MSTTPRHNAQLLADPDPKLAAVARRRHTKTRIIFLFFPYHYRGGALF